MKLRSLFGRQEQPRPEQENNSSEGQNPKVLFISPGIGYDNEIDVALEAAGFEVATVYRAVNMPLPRNPKNIGSFLEFVSWEGEKSPNWKGYYKPDVIASCGLVKKFEVGDNPMCVYDAAGLAEVSGIAYADLAPGIIRSMASVIIPGIACVCEPKVAVARVQKAVSSSS